MSSLHITSHPSVLPSQESLPLVILSHSLLFPLNFIVTLEQPLNIPLPKIVTELGIVIFLRFTKPLNALSSISLIVLGNTTVFTLVK